MATICSLPLSKRLTDQLVELDLVQFDEIATLSEFDLREIRLDRPARIELARAPAPPQSTMRWVRVRLNKLSPLLNRGWVWKTLPLRRRERIVLVSPRGVVWEFKLHHGAWLRRVTESQK